MLVRCYVIEGGQQYLKLVKFIKTDMRDFLDKRK